MAGGMKNGIALRCDPQGMIVETLQNNLDIEIPPGKLFVTLVDVSSRVKALNFFEEIRKNSAAFNWEINLPLSEEPVAFYFSGGIVNDQFLIVGAANDEEARRLYEDLLNMNNEQVNGLRAALKDSIQASRAAVQNKDAYDDVSRLNNELVAMQRELARKNAELERLNLLKNQFLGMAAHDLRNPLAIIQSYSELLLDGNANLDEPERAEFLANINSLSQFMHGLVDDLLSVSAIESGKLDLRLERVYLPALVEKVVARHRRLAAVRKIEIETEVEMVPPASLDPGRIEQVLDNLIGNAVKFSQPGNVVRVGVSRREDNALLTVADRGPGIAAADMEKIFKPFGRLNAQSASGERSTGLGLIIVKRIVERHGGTIRLESELGQGATFFVSLPLETTENKA